MILLKRSSSEQSFNEIFKNNLVPIISVIILYCLVPFRSFALERQSHSCWIQSLPIPGRHRYSSKKKNTTILQICFHMFHHRQLNTENHKKGCKAPTSKAQRSNGLSPLSSRPRPFFPRRSTVLCSKTLAVSVGGCCSQFLSTSVDRRTGGSCRNKLVRWLSLAGETIASFVNRRLT